MELNKIMNKAYSMQLTHSFEKYVIYWYLHFAPIGLSLLQKRLGSTHVDRLCLFATI